MTFERFEEIRAWQAARRLARKTEKVIDSTQLAKDYALRDQIRRAVNSMMSNIAEGHSRRTDREFVQFLFVAKSSSAELQSHFYLAQDRGYVSNRTFRELFEDADNYKRMVSGLISYLTRGKKARK